MQPPRVWPSEKKKNNKNGERQGWSFPPTASSTKSSGQHKNEHSFTQKKTRVLCCLDQLAFPERRLITCADTRHKKKKKSMTTNGRSSFVRVAASYVNQETNRMRPFKKRRGGKRTVPSPQPSPDRLWFPWEKGGGLLLHSSPCWRLLTPAVGRTRGKGGRPSGQRRQPAGAGCSLPPSQPQVPTPWAVCSGTRCPLRGGGAAQGSDAGRRHWRRRQHTQGVGADGGATC